MGYGGPSSVQGLTRLQIGDTGHRAQGGAHVKHPVHVRDAGRVEAQRLVEYPCCLPSRKESMRCETRCRGGGGRGVARRRLPSGVQGRRNRQMHGRALAERTRSM